MNAFEQHKTVMESQSHKLSSQPFVMQSKYWQKDIFQKKMSFLWDNGMAKMGNGSLPKIDIRGHFASLFSAMRDANHCGLIIRRCQYDWNVTKKILLIWEWQHSGSQNRLQITSFLSVFWSFLGFDNTEYSSGEINYA